jgi:hypothetical protein
MSKSNGPIPRPKLEARLKKIGSWEDAAFYLRERGVKVTSSYLSMLARGTRDPALPMARQLADALGIKLVDIVGE